MKSQRYTIDLNQYTTDNPNGKWVVAENAEREIKELEAKVERLHDLLTTKERNFEVVLKDAKNRLDKAVEKIKSVTEWLERGSNSEKGISQHQCDVLFVALSKIELLKNLQPRKKGKG